GGVFRGTDFFLLDFGRGSARRSNGAGIRHGDVALGIDVLVRQSDKIAGTDAGFDRNEEPTGRRLENRNTHGVTDAERDLSRWSAVGKYVADSGRVGR